MSRVGVTGFGLVRIALDLYFITGAPKDAQQKRL